MCRNFAAYQAFGVKVHVAAISGRLAVIVFKFEREKLPDSHMAVWILCLEVPVIWGMRGYNMGTNRWRYPQFNACPMN